MNKRMENMDVLKEIRKLKEANLSVQNHLADLEAKVLKNQNNKKNDIKMNGNLNFNFQNPKRIQSNRSSKFEKSHHISLDSNTDVFDIQKFEIIEELYQRSRKHLENFQKRCDDLLNRHKQVNIKNKSSKKKYRSNNLHLNNFNEEDIPIKNRSNQKNPNFNKEMIYQNYQPNISKHKKHTSIDHKVNNFDDQAYGNFCLTNENNHDYHPNLYNDRNFNNQNYMKNIGFYKNYALSINTNDKNESSFSNKSHSSDSSLIDENEYDENGFLTPNTTDSIDDSDNFTFSRKIYLNPEEFTNIPNIPNNYQYKYSNNINQRFLDSYQDKIEDSYSFKHKNEDSYSSKHKIEDSFSSKHKNSISSSSEFSMLSTLSSSSLDDEPSFSYF